MIGFLQPWLLAALSGVVQQVISRNANEALRIGQSKNDSSAERKTP